MRWGSIYGSPVLVAFGSIAGRDQGPNCSYSDISASKCKCAQIPTSNRLFQNTYICIFDQLQFIHKLLKYTSIHCLPSSYSILTHPSIPPTCITNNKNHPFSKTISMRYSIYITIACTT
ncbi:hypothetical protein EJ08DRAFT_132229 [Tothia fuscella]|uniref:Uncharacterized protein n=1 Tax=Tothia fuscella TaxID=1048955 RepID=A0A9P4U0G3_9PEZI|nr:hypothetical protein EJ08DRAFT_132229 [Tothia fuscella]